MAETPNATEASSWSSVKTKELEIFLAAFYTLIAVVGIAGNSLVINVVRKNLVVKTATNIMLLNLAAADLLSLVWSLPKRYVDLIDAHLNGDLGTWMCKLVTANNMAAITLAVSVYTLTLLAVERYYALVKPFQPPRINDNNVVYALLGTWIVASVAQIPAFVGTTLNNATSSCESPWITNDAARSLKGAVVSIVTLNIFLPLVAITFCYAVVVNGLYWQKTICARTVDPRDLQAKKKIVKLLIAVTLSFFACFLPFASYMMVLALVPLDSLSRQERSSFLKGFEVAKCLMYSSSCLNPVLYAFQSSNYRRGFKRSVPCVFSNRRVVHSDITARGTANFDRTKSPQIRLSANHLV